MKNYFLKPSWIISVLLICSLNSFGQLKTNNADKIARLKLEQIYSKKMNFQDTAKPKKSAKNFSLHGIFISAGGGLSVPISDFNAYSNATFGILGRLEFSSTTIFPFVIGGEVDYFSYNGYDLYKTLHVLNNLTTKIFSYGLNIEYTFSKILNSSYTIPFLTVDVKNNVINREYDDNVTVDELQRKQTKVSIGAGFGFTLFVFDFYVKYNYMKTVSNIGIYTKVKFPLIRF